VHGQSDPIPAGEYERPSLRLFCDDGPVELGGPGLRRNSQREEQRERREDLHSH
jgi:hypothetical protein